MKARLVCLSVSLGLAIGWAPATAQVSTPLGTPINIATGDHHTGLDPRLAQAMLAKPISVTLDHAPLKVAVQTIVANAHLDIQYRAELLDAAHRMVTLRADEIPLGVALERALTGTGLIAIPLSITEVAIVPVQIDHDGVITGIITGHVIDAKTKLPVAKASLAIDGATRSVQTQEDGTFRIPNVAPGAHRITVRMLGYLKQIVTADVVDGQTVQLDVALSPSASALDQVVVTGTVIPMAIKAVPSAITVITADQIEKRGITRIDQLFRGDVPGLFAVNLGSASALDSVSMFSRGATSLQPTTAINGPAATNTIKTYVDGIELANSSYLSQIDPRSIERIEILTGPQASTIYGSNAVNGVMQIFTKRGTTTRPQFVLDLLNGLVQNNFGSALSPVHTADARISGTEQRWSYQAGGSWDYTGAWTPGKQTAQTGGFAGVRTQFAHITTDASFRQSLVRNRNAGELVSQEAGARREDGFYPPAISLGNGSRYAASTRSRNGQTLGLSVSYAPTTWWSHELVVGVDQNDTQSVSSVPGWVSPTDSSLSFEHAQDGRTSQRYTTTAQFPLMSSIQTILTAGADAWQRTQIDLDVDPATLTGTLTGDPSITRATDHNAGGFFQGQIGIRDAVFLTYGLRAEWNPNYGEAAEPNFAPRYGAVYTREFGIVTAKVRASYGRATRPPARGEKLAVPVATYIPSYVQGYGPYDYYLAAPDLGPEYQQGGEGGLELYVGNRGSLVVTRYNQTVDALIVSTKVDSVQSLLPNPSSYTKLGTDGYGYRYQYRYLNIGDVRNQGWELQSTLNTGAITTKGTYSWTKSRVIGITPAYRSVLTGKQYQVGSSFQYLPEHTWAVQMTYAHAATVLSLNLDGVGQSIRASDMVKNLFSDPRLDVDNPRKSTITNYTPRGPGYVMADLNLSHRFSHDVEGVAQIQNLGDVYQDDMGNEIATIGRQTKVGLRIRY